MMKQRFWEIDSIRGIAIIMMIAFHVMYDLLYFNIYRVDIYSGFWFYVARLTASIFIVLVGISLTLSSSKGKKAFPKYLKRGIKVFSLGMILTFITMFFPGEGFIIFGILHFIGLSIIFAFPFVRRRGMSLILGVSAIIIGLYLSLLRFDFPWLSWLGFIPANFYTIDYFPVFPWFGLILIGIFLGNLFYPEYKRRIEIPDLSGHIVVKLFSFLGRNSLIIYLIHQPVILSIVYLAGILK